MSGDDDLPGMTKDEPSLTGVLLPVNRAVSLRAVLFAISLACLGFITQGFIWFSEEILGIGTPGSIMVYVLSIIAGVGAAVNGYVNDDLLVSCCIAIAPVTGFALFSAALWLVGVSPVLSETGQMALLVGAVTGLLGSIVGLGSVWIGRRYGGGRKSPTLD